MTSLAVRKRVEETWQAGYCLCLDFVFFLCLVVCNTFQSHVLLVGYCRA